MSRVLTGVNHPIETEACGREPGGPGGEGMKTAE